MQLALGATVNSHAKLRRVVARAIIDSIDFERMSMKRCGPCLRQGIIARCENCKVQPEQRQAVRGEINKMEFVRLKLHQRYDSQVFIGDWVSIRRRRISRKYFRKC